MVSGPFIEAQPLDQMLDCARICRYKMREHVSGDDTGESASVQARRERSGTGAQDD
jgi:hypothetical protein